MKITWEVSDIIAGKRVQVGERPSTIVAIALAQPSINDFGIWMAPASKYALAVRGLIYTDFVLRSDLARMLNEANARPLEGIEE